ncbi:UbiA family prenyltransferase [Paraliomyxa miuraensis]|uniref:UbiA family prenyltransferase n=1 Tax=Paraliomyxa miuraensis TaxID=376150 RepID=UPI00225BBF66|nr:UbiA family prenyltransferase [Paraliomyxa miuraensis]MCX4247838.1 UbiA family prenyltransferase [Paraliomyxa miuraensis]
MPAELKIVLDVARYRIGRLEMANLVAAVAIMLALQLSLPELMVRTGFGMLLNLLVYLNNDWFDLDDDLMTSTRDRHKTAYLAAHRGAALRAQWGLLGLCCGFASLWGGGLWLPLTVGAGICWLYSARLKRRPFVDVGAMMVWGMAMPAVAVPPGAAEGWWLLWQLGLFSGVFETIQVLRDREADARRGIRTTAVVLGRKRTQWLARGLMLLAGAYAGWCFHPVLVVLPWVAAALPIPAVRIEGYWNRVRVLLGSTLLLECALLYARAGG